MKRLLINIGFIIGLLSFLVENSNAQTITDSSEILDSIIIEITSDFTHNLKANEVIGTWTRTDGFFSRAITFKENGKYILKDHGCMRSLGTKRGKWKLNETDVSLINSKESRHLNFIQKNQEIVLIDPYQIEETFLLPNDLLKMGKLSNAEINNFKESLIFNGWTKTSAP